VIIRPVRVEDASALHAACWPERSCTAIQMRIQTALDLAARGRGWGRVAEIADEVVGYGQITRWHKPYVAEISNLAVSEPRRGLGVGTALIMELLAVAHREGIREVEIGVAQANRRAMALYERLGFIPFRKTILDMGDGPEVIVYLSLVCDGDLSG